MLNDKNVSGRNFKTKPNFIPLKTCEKRMLGAKFKHFKINQISLQMLSRNCFKV